VLWRNLLNIVLPGLLSVFTSWLLNNYTQLPTAHWILALVFFIVFCLILNFIYAAKAASKDFTQLLLACIVIKLLISLIALVIYWLINKAGFFNFAMHFILYYVLFTIFEIGYILQLLKIKSSTTNEN
jgi:hypothetical protein